MTTITTPTESTEDHRPARRRRRGLRRAVYAVLTVTGLVAGISGFALFQAFVAKPANGPDAFRGADAGPLTVVAGASTVQGTISADWVSGLHAPGTEVVNAGINGHTTRDLLDRLERDVIELDPENVVLLVGTNDIRGDVAPATSKENVEEILDRLTRETTADVAMMSLQPLGEQLDSSRNARVRAYNAMVAAAAAERGVDYLPLYESLVPIVEERTGPAPDFSFPIIRTAFDRFVFGRSFNDMSDSHGLRVTADNVHLNERGAAVAQRLAGDWLAGR